LPVMTTPYSCMSLMSGFNGEAGGDGRRVRC
jgi:hypothetical protein